MKMTKFEYSSSMYHDANSIGRDKFLDKYGEDKEELYDHIKELDYIIWRVRNTITQLEENSMSRVNDWLLEMEEDATHLTLDEWTTKHGSGRKEIWNRVQTEREEDQLTMELPNE
jgi:regulator of replication initiation timing